jgi:hypothetical protein
VLAQGCWFRLLFAEPNISATNPAFFWLIGRRRRLALNSQYCVANSLPVLRGRRYLFHVPPLGVALLMFGIPLVVSMFGTA